MQTAGYTAVMSQGDNTVGMGRERRFMLLKINNIEVSEK